MSSDAVIWLAQELSFTCLEDDEAGRTRALSGTLALGARGLEDAAAQLAGLPHDHADVIALVGRAREGGRGVLDVGHGRLIAWNVGPARARVLFAPAHGVLARKAAAADRAAGVTHEVANALTAIAGWARMAAAVGPLPERTRHALDVVQRSARDALGSARELLGTMREAARGTIAPGTNAPTDASAVVGEMLETLRPRLEEAGVGVDADLGDGVRGAIPAARLRLIAGNLIQNALEALSSGGTVRVCVRDEGGEMRLTIADDGPGMNDATLAQAFDRYFTTKECGTGLGLALVADAVHEAGGRIETESRRGAGTRFDVWLPAPDARRDERPAPRTRASSGVHPRPALVDQSVLVVDDDEAMRALMCTALELQGARVFAAAGHDEALALEGTFALALVDLSLGDHRGDALLARLRAEARVGRTILITGAPDAELDPRGAPDAVLRKPFELEELTQAIDALIDPVALEAEG